MFTHPAERVALHDFLHARLQVMKSFAALLKDGKIRVHSGWRKKQLLNLIEKLTRKRVQVSEEDAQNLRLWAFALDGALKGASLTAGEETDQEARVLIESAPEAAAELNSKVAEMEAAMIREIWPTLEVCREIRIPVHT